MILFQNKPMTEKTFVEQLEKFFNTNDYLTKKEVGVGYGIADLVIVKKTSIIVDNYILRASHGQYNQLLKEDYFRLLKLIPDISSNKKPAHLDTLVRKTNLSKSLLKYNILRLLEKNKFIKSEGDNYYFKINGWMPLAKEIIAIEAKLKDWKRGFIQANRYKAFADKVYLAVPAETAHLVNKQLLSKHNVGLISLSYGQNKTDYILKPHREKPLNDYMRNMAAEYFWEKRTLKEFAVV